MPTEESSPAKEPAPFETVDHEARKLLGMLVAPSFARRGTEVEFLRKRLCDRLNQERDGMLDMVRLRLREWSRAADGPAAWPFPDGETATFDFDALFRSAGLDAPTWSRRAESVRVRRRIARDLIAAVDRFNRRWTAFVRAVDLTIINKTIDEYNSYYLFEKECVLGSSRLAERHFEPLPNVTAESILNDFPPLAAPGG